MKKIIFTLGFLVITTLCFAQVRYGITAGGNMANISEQFQGGSVSTSTLVSFHAGFLADDPLSDYIYFQPQLLLSGKGGRSNSAIVNSGGNVSSGKTSINPFYLELPLNFIYKAHAGNNTLYVGIGPYAAVGLFGKYKEPDYSQKLTFGNTDNNNLRRVDFGGDIVVGYELTNGFLLNATYSQGIANIAPGVASGYKIHNQCFEVSIGYLFGSGDGNGYY